MSLSNTTTSQNFNETLKQWSGVLGYTYGAPQQTLPNNPSAPYTKYVYGPNLVGVYGTGVGHNIPINGAQDLDWFGITGGGGTQPPPPASTTTSSGTAAPTSTPPPSTCEPVARWGQCAGQGYTGCTVCQAPWTCTYGNAYYSQCL